MSEEKLFTYDEILEKADTLLRVADTFTNRLIIANFQIGALVSALMDEAQYGEGAVLKLAYDLTGRKGYTVYPQRLYECARVYRTFEGDIQRIWNLERKIQFKVSWSYLARNCTKEPLEGREAILHWESKIARWEGVLDEVAEACLKKEEIIERVPEPVKTEIQGFFEEVENPDRKLSVDLSEKRLVSLFKRLDNLLSGLISFRRPVDESVRKLLLAISSKIDRILGASEPVRKD